LVIIPAYNEAESLPPLIRALAGARLPEPWALDVLVVSDGSTDHTAAAMAGLPARLIELPCNLGVGGAVQTGLQFAVQQGYEFAMQVDGDGQHPPEEIPALLRRMDAGGVDMVLGSRFAAAGEGFQSTATRRLGIRLFAAMLTALCRQRFTDTTSGFRLWNRRALEMLAADYPEDYPEVEAILRLHHAGLRMAEVPVRMAERTAGRSTIGAWQVVNFLVKVPLALFMGVSRKNGSEGRIQKVK
jgi:glycosyltransferase involved in cell wall biosynthesis